jgi:hypothetical protein
VLNDAPDLLGEITVDAEVQIRDLGGRNDAQVIEGVLRGGYRIAEAFRELRGDLYRGKVFAGVFPVMGDFADVKIEQRFLASNLEEERPLQSAKSSTRISGCTA